MEEVREAAKREVRRKVWASNRGKATRAYIRDHPEVVEQFETEGKIVVGELPEYVTVAAVLLELSQRRARRELNRLVREWKEEHPEEAKRIEEEIRREREAGEK